MPFNGAGMFVRVRNWVADAAAGIKIRADYHDIEDDGFASGLSQCVVRDGQSVVLANIPMNSKRLIALADPIDPQDASTKAYADTKLPLAGGTISGNLGVTGNLDVAGNVSAFGYKTRTGLPGPYGANFFNFNYTGGNLNAWVDNTNLGALATQAFANTAAANAAAPKVNRAGDTMTGSLTTNGYLCTVANALYFSSIGSAGFIAWGGGNSYTLGGAGTIWHNGNLNPVLAIRTTSGSGSVATGATFGATGGVTVVTGLTYSNLQYLTPSGWVTVG